MADRKDMHHVVVMGTRPEIIKMSPVIKEIQRREQKLTLIDTGQHYDFEMSKVFYEQLELPNPDYHFELARDRPNEQIGQILENLLNVLGKIKPDIVYAQGDTNTVLASAIASQRLLTPFGHVEAGIRSYDLTMPEEVNRRVASVCANVHFCPTERAAQNLRTEGISESRIEITGNTIVDAIESYFRTPVEESRIVRDLRAIERSEGYLVLTLHRPATVDNMQVLARVLNALSKIEIPIAFFVHPRTSERLKKSGLGSLLDSGTIRRYPPLGYFEFLDVLRSSKGVLTDSGGIQEESVTLKIPAITLRPNTERPESVETGTNVLVSPLGADLERILVTEVSALDERRRKIETVKNPFGDGKSGAKIVENANKRFETGELAHKVPTQYP